MLIAIHQPNFIPWFPFFEKMARCDAFVILKHCQFEKNGFQNRALVENKWWTMPVQNGMHMEIAIKKYTNGIDLVDLNIRFIQDICDILHPKLFSKIIYDSPTDKTGTDRIIEICKQNLADEYLVNMEAVEKYLDLKKMADAKIKLVSFKSQYKKHTFEMFSEYGIDTCQNIIASQFKEHQS